jgi:hypothetical protein
MVLHICKPETIRVIEEIAQRTGQSAERVVETAVYEYRARLETPEEKAQRRAGVDRLVGRLQARFREHPEAIVDIDELLYDENGLPK